MNYKNLNKEHLNKLFKDVNFKTQPMEHQLISMAFSIDKDRVAFFHGVGTGKTLTSLYTQKYVWQAKKVLIVCPMSVVSSWQEEIEKHTDCSAITLLGNKTKRNKLLKEKADFYIINYDGLIPLFAKYKKQGKKRIFSICFDKIKRQKFDGIIIDEAHSCKNEQAKRSKILYYLSKYSKFSIGLTGTPTVNSEDDLFGIYLVLDNGKTFGRNKWRFLNKYFKKIVNYARGRKFITWEIKPNSRVEILNKIKNRTIRFSREECIDLPEAVYQKRFVKLTKEQVKEIKKLINNNEEEPIKIYSKLEQIPGGFIYRDDKTIRFKNNKIKELEKILKDLEGKVIIFHEFVEEGRMIEDLCNRINIKYASMRSEIKHKEKERLKFINDKDVRVLIAHPDSAGTGTNGLQDVCQIMIFYSNGYSAEKRTQNEGRILRKGQKNNCLYIDLICENSLDEKHLRVIEGKYSMIEAVLDYIENFRKNS